MEYYIGDPLVSLSQGVFNRYLVPSKGVDNCMCQRPSLPATPWKCTNLFNIWHKIHLVKLLLRFVSIRGLMGIYVYVSGKCEPPCTR